MRSADEHLGTQADAQGNVSARAQITSLQGVSDDMRCWREDGPEQLSPSGYSNIEADPPYLTRIGVLPSLLRPSERYIVNPAASPTPTLLLDRQHRLADPLAHDASARVPALRRPPRSQIEQLNGKVSTFLPLHRHEQGCCHGLDEAAILAGEIA
jgi:hypothetical protein